jgi:hypothetical protein
MNTPKLSLKVLPIIIKMLEPVRATVHCFVARKKIMIKVPLENFKRAIIINRFESDYRLGKILEREQIHNSLIFANEQAPIVSFIVQTPKIPVKICDCLVTARKKRALYNITCYV